MNARTILPLACLLAAACAAQPAALPSPTFTPQTTNASPVDRTKPPELIQTQQPLDAPTFVLWSADRTDDSGRPYFFELNYDGAAMGFRVRDSSGSLVARLPIAGSGIFGPETCLSTLHSGKRMAATWIAIDAVTYRDIATRWSSFVVEIDTIGHGTITLPLQDSGCRRDY